MSCIQNGQGISAQHQGGMYLITAPPEQNKFKKDLIEKINSLKDQTVSSFIKKKGESSSFFHRVEVSISFFRKHPLASYPDPGERPAGLLKILSLEKKKKWDQTVDKILPLQGFLLSKTSSLYFTKKYLERKYIEITREIKDPLKLYINNTSLKIIALLAHQHSLTSSNVEIEEALPILASMHSTEISEEAIILCKNFLKFFYLDHRFLTGQASSELLQILTAHLNKCLSDDKSINTFMDFWEKYTYTDLKSISVFYLFQCLVDNFKLLKKNGLKLTLSGAEKNITDINFEELPWNGLDQLLNEVLKSRDFPNPQDNWQYAENLCNIHLATELINLNF